jgi:hypothetical protein
MSEYFLKSPSAIRPGSTQPSIESANPRAYENPKRRVPAQLLGIFPLSRDGLQGRSPGMYIRTAHKPNAQPASHCGRNTSYDRSRAVGDFFHVQSAYVQFGIKSQTHQHVPTRVRSGTRNSPVLPGRTASTLQLDFRAFPLSSGRKHNFPQFKSVSFLKLGHPSYI